MRKFFFIIPFFVIFVACGNGNRNKNSGRKTLKINKGEYNVLLITIDTLRFDRLSIYSDKYVKTPNIDKFASDSFVFLRGFSHNPVTFPSHTNILTGTTSLYHGISDNSGFVLEDRFLTVAELLKKNDYKTGAFVGSFPLDSRFGLNQGFDVYDDNYGTHNNQDLFFVERKAEEVIKPALRWIGDKKGKWFCWIHLFDPHQPYNAPAPYNSRYSNDLYSAEVAYTDSSLGKLFDQLKILNKYDNTIIILTADHGEALGEKGEETHAYFAYNNTIHVPFIIRVPGSKGGRIDENVAHIDIFPTICEILDIKIPSHIQGEGLGRVMNGGKRKEQYIYFESLTPHLNRNMAPLRGFIHGNDKYIDQPIREFYNISEDMFELKNLIAKKKGGDLKYKLNKLIAKLTNKDKIKRAGNLDSETRRKLKSLGYLSETVSIKKKKYTEKDDLKTRLHIHVRMFNALGTYQAGNTDLAIKELKEIIRINPNYTSVYSHLAKIYKEIGQVQKSVSILKEGLKNNPGNILLLSNFGIFLVENGEYRLAIDSLNQCTLLNKHDPEIFNYLGVAYYRIGDFDKAMLNYRKSLEIDTNYAAIYNNIGSLYLSKFQRSKERGSFDDAILNFNKAIKIDDKLFSAFNGRGAARYFAGDISGAISDWKRVLLIEPEFIDSYFSIGIAYLLKIGDKITAYKYFQLCKDKFYKHLPKREKARLDRLIQQSLN